MADASRRVRMLTSVDLRLLPQRCDGCPVPTQPTGANAWVTAAERRWGFVGVGSFDGDALTSYALVAPSLHVPSSHRGHRRFYADPRSAVLLSLRLPDSQPKRAPNVLLEMLAARLKLSRSPVNALESLATVVGAPTCVAPRLVVLENAGFRVVHADPLLPVCRLDLRAGVLSRSWELARATGRRVGAQLVRPRPQTSVRNQRVATCDREA